jgi:hypothetical protein
MSDEEMQWRAEATLCLEQALGYLERGEDAEARVDILRAAGWIDKKSREQIVLRRDGDAPLAFRGERIATADTRETQGDGQNRWNEVAIYRTAGGRYVVAIEYHTQWQGEAGTREAHALGPDLADVAECLRTTIPVPEGIGYPPGDQYADRQARMEASLRRRWEAMVGRILSEIGAAERIE